MILSGIKKISIYNPETQEVIQLNKIANEGTFEKNPYEVENSKGELLYAGIDATLEFTSYDTSAFATLNLWMKNKIPINLVVAGIDNYIGWYENSYFTIIPIYNMQVGNLNGFRVNVKYKGVGDKIKQEQDIFLLNRNWTDSNANGVIDEATFTIANGTPTFTNRQNYSSTTTTPGDNIKLEMFFPISGVEVKREIFLIKDENNTTLELIAYDKNNNILATTTNEKIFTPSNIYKLALKITFNQTAVGKVTQIVNKSLIYQYDWLTTIFSLPLIAEFIKQGKTDFENIKEITAIDLNSRGLTGELKGLKYLKKLTSLKLYNNQLTNIGDLSGLNNLTNLHLADNQLTDIGDLSGLDNMQNLNLHNNQLTNIGDLSGLNNLTELHLADNQLTDIGDLSELNNLQYLYFHNNIYLNNYLAQPNRFDGYPSIKLMYINNCGINSIDYETMNLGSTIQKFYINNNKLSTLYVDAILNHFRVKRDALQYPNLLELRLDGAAMGIPTGGANNADYLALVASGVSVTIRTS